MSIAEAPGNQESAGTMGKAAETHTIMDYTGAPNLKAGLLIC